MVGVWTTKTKFYEISEYMVRLYPLHYFNEILKVCRQFLRGLIVKIWGIRARGYRVTGVLFPKFSAPPSSETIYVGSQNI